MSALAKWLVPDRGRALVWKRVPRVWASLSRRSVKYRTSVAAIIGRFGGHAF